MVENEVSEFPPVSSILQFARISGNERLTEGVGNEYKGKKYQENIVVNTDYSILQKVS